MRAFAQKQNHPQQRAPISLAKSNALAPAASQHAHGSLLFERATSTLSSFASDFSRIPVHGQAQPTTKLWRKCACGGSCPQCKSEEHRDLQRKDAGSSEPGQTDAPPIVQEALSRDGGSLPNKLRADMEHCFGHDFNNVRLHTHALAAESAAAVGARAYTVGRDVVFANGEYAPHTDAGRRLIAHELAHVVQQTGADAPIARAGITIGASNDPLEREAESAAQRVYRGSATGIAGAALSAGVSKVARQPLLQRDDGPGNKKEEKQLPRVPYRDKPDSSGDKAQSQEGEPEKGPALALASGARPTCEPKGFLRKDYLAQPNTSTDDFGLTRFAGTVSMALPTQKVKGGATLIPLQVALPPITSVFTAADTFDEDMIMFVSQPGAYCPTAKVPKRWHIFPVGAAKIREGELEHCEDLQYAYDVTFGWYSQVVDREIAKKPKFPSEEAAFRHLKKLTGTDPRNWASVFKCLIKKTELRDGKKGSNAWHTPQVKPQEPRLNDGCSFSRVNVGGSNFPELSKHPTPSIISGCGESPAAVKALAAQAAAAKASAGGEGEQQDKPGEPPPKTPAPPPKSTEPAR